MHGAHKEVEVKLRVANLGALRRKLARLKLHAPNGRVHEFNVLYDTPQGGLAKHGQLLRVRVETPQGKGRKKSGVRAVLTYKGPAVPGTRVQVAELNRYKVREEEEVSVGDATTIGSILEALGLRGWFRYEKYRTSYEFPASAKWAHDLRVELDETPIGVFLELEGAPDAIDRAAMMLEYESKDYITKSYLALYLDQRRRSIPTPASGQGKDQTGLSGMLFP